MLVRGFKISVRQRSKFLRSHTTRWLYLMYYFFHNGWDRTSSFSPQKWDKHVNLALTIP
jgi:hypothetical protein